MIEKGFYLFHNQIGFFDGKTSTSRLIGPNQPYLVFKHFDRVFSIFTWRVLKELELGNLRLL